jgi:hypothetical protein
MRNLPRGTGSGFESNAESIAITDNKSARFNKIGTGA